MAYVINHQCISCGACEPECPVESIYEGVMQYNIDPDTCIDCGICTEVCPMEAIHPEM
ncbi:MAG: 4Fe-4S binding protein [Tissierellia bacterium]|nr:4Fe-4S binding protein [Tissierellia bacterium]